MTKWKNLAGKFSEEQLAEIREFQKQLGLNENKLIQISVIFTIFFLPMMLRLIEIQEAQKVDKKYQSFKKKVSKYPQLKEITPFIQDMQKLWEGAVRQVIAENEPKFKKFTKKRKVGRPKSKKRKRGRPADRGI